MSNVLARVRTDPRARSVLAAVAGFAFLAAFTQVVLPGTGDGRGTPAAILFLGMTTGLVTGLTAAGLILVYRTLRIINFAQTAIGGAGGALTFQLVQLTDAPFAVAFAAGLVLAGLVGLAFDLVLGRRFLSASRLVLTVATIAVAGLSVITVDAVRNLPFFPDQTILEGLGSEPVRHLLPFAGFDFQVGDFPIPFGFPELFAIEVSVVLLLLVAGFMRFTRAGVAVRAMAENRERAALLGIGVGNLSSIVWTIAGVLGGASVILSGAMTTPAVGSGVAPGVLLPALAAAVIARFRSITGAVLAAVALSIASAATQHSYPDDTALIPIGYFVVIGAGLLLQRRRAGRSEEGAGVSWQAVDEQRSIPQELNEVPTVRITRWVLIGLGVVAVAVYPYLVETRPIILGGIVALTAVVALSVVVLTGWTGQVSLGQFGFAAIGAVVGGSLTSRTGLPFWLAVPAAATVTGALAAVIGIPALRIQGLFLAAATLAFAFAVQFALFEERYFGWLLPDDIERPTLFFLDFSDERSMYYLTVATLIVALVVVANFRRSRVGRLLIASRDNEANLEALGVPVLRTKLIGFAIAGALAGLAGAVLAHQQLGAAQDSFLAQRSIDVFLLTVVGGIVSPAGALLGAAFWSVTEYFYPTQPVVQFLKPFAVIIVLYTVPGGLIAVLTGVRDEVLRIIAQRRQLVVPSLFADYDPDALARRLIPLRAPGESEALAAVGGARRYTLTSELYPESARRSGNGSSSAASTAEAAVIAAAGEAQQEEPDVDEGTHR